MLIDNFRRPYLSRSVPEFWGQRWHVSLAFWFRDYLYIPMGGNRVSRPRWYMNQMMVFLVSGIWHGANWTFLVWGALNGLYQVLYYLLGGARSKLASVLPRWLWNLAGILLTFHLILISWVFFRAETVAAAWKIITKIFASVPKYPMLISSYNWTSSFWLALGLIILLMIVETLDEIRSLWDRLASWPIVLRWGAYYSVLGCLLLIGRWTMGQFVYAQF
jgi:alginate O-acetyltransferase complex protein AlgI